MYELISTQELRHIYPLECVGISSCFAFPGSYETLSKEFFFQNVFWSPSILNCLVVFTQNVKFSAVFIQFTNLSENLTGSTSHDIFTIPNPIQQPPRWEETRAPGENPRLSAEC